MAIAKIAVVIKQVPDTESKIKLAPDGHSYDTTGMKWVMNPYDEFAVEEAIKLRDANPGSSVHVFSLGPATRVNETLRTALAMGADEAYVIDAAQFLDPLQIAKGLAQALKAEGGADIVFAGKLAIDDNSFSVGQMMAHYLGWPYATQISKFSIQGGSASVERDIEGGAKENIEVPLPAVFTTNKGLNMPRYASLPGIMKAKKKTIKVIPGSSLDFGSATWNIEAWTLPAEKPPVKMIQGAAAQQATSLVQALRDEAKVL